MIHTRVELYLKHNIAIKRYPVLTSLECMLYANKTLLKAFGFYPHFYVAPIMSILGSRPTIICTLTQLSSILILGLPYVISCSSATLATSYPPFQS